MPGIDIEAQTGDILTESESKEGSKAHRLRTKTNNEKEIKNEGRKEKN
jgi:hypothetical protein